MPSPYDTPTRPCPYCGDECEADFADIGVGMQQCGPYHCLSCGASEISAYDEYRPLTFTEKETGWYAPDSPVGSTCNTIFGTPVDHGTAKRLYEFGLLDQKG